jgi:hypothetical protein
MAGCGTGRSKLSQNTGLTQVQPSGSKAMRKLKKDRIREDRIHNEAIVDAGPDEQAMSWYYYLESKISFPFQAKCVAAKLVSPLRKGEAAEVVRMAPENACMHDMLVQIRWRGQKIAVPLSQLDAIDPDELTKQTIGDWHYWVSQGYLL